ncbi:MAG: TVP38/TMEM64 family protein [Pirellulales bacterium]
MLRKSLKRSLLWGAFLVVGTLLAFAPGICDCTLAALGWIEQIGVWGPIALIAIYLVATVALIPGTLLTLGAGAIFGLWIGTITVVIGSNAGALAAFLLGRSLFCDWARSIAKKSDRLLSLDNAVAENGFRIVFLTRLSPLFPFNVLNYAFGLTRVSAKDYVVASAVGMLPGTFLYVYLGASAGSLLALRQTDQSDMASQALFGAGLVATIILTAYLHRIAQVQLERDQKTELLRIAEIGRPHMLRKSTLHSDAALTTERLRQGD